MHHFPLMNLSNSVNHTVIIRQHKNNVKRNLSDSKVDQNHQNIRPKSPQHTKHASVTTLTIVVVLCVSPASVLLSPMIVLN